MNAVLQTGPALGAGSGRTLRVRASAAVLLAVAGAVLLVPLLLPLDEQAVDMAHK
ncbi:ABC transporter permease, partial [Streptomyces oryzae]|nr:ABC transporter permease [Streptomyces oryzae]